MKKLLLLLLVLTACTKTNKDGYKTYTIEQGFHNSNEWLYYRPLQDHNLRQSIYFGFKCWYDKSLVTHSGYNKLTGLTQIGGIHSKSGRIVWQPDFDNVNQIKLSAYVYGSNRGYVVNHENYIDGEKFISEGGWVAEYITTVQTGKPFEIEVNCLSDRWQFSVNGIKVEIFADTPDGLLGLCIPYFGGRDAAYHQMNFYIKEL